MKFLPKSWKNKSPNNDQILGEMMQAECNTSYSDIHKLNNSIWKKEELPQQWKESIAVLMYKKGDITDCSHYRDISMFQLHKNFIWGLLHIQIKLLGIICWISSQQINYLSDILHLSDTGEKMGVKWTNTSAPGLCWW
jgi:hypothetical protein